MPYRFLPAIALAFFLSGPALAQDSADARKQFFTDLAAMEKTARERLFTPAEWEHFSALERAASELVEAATKKQAELERSGKAELYRLFVRASRLQAAGKAKTLTADQAAEKARIDDEIFRLAEPLLTARHEELSAKKDAGTELTLREMAVFDGLTRWRSTAATVPADPVDELSAPRMDVRQLIWIEQIAIMDLQGQVRRDLRIKEQMAEIYRWLARRAEATDAVGREDTLARIAAWKAKKRD
jgi:hypothetical protein